VRSLLAAIAFLTRIPIGEAAFDANDVAHSAGWFPLIGALLGAAYSGIAWALEPHLPAVLIAVLLVTVDALATGALHFDGLADMADGFGGGKTRDDVLRIMRDHAIGSYGGLALVLVVALRLAAYSSLLAQPTDRNWMVALIVTPALGRWSILLLTAMLPYARQGISVAGYIERQSLVWGTLVVMVILIAAISMRAWIAAGIIVVVTGLFGSYCRRRIGGITGDTLGANLQICESAALITFLWIGFVK
jgi:adenosylcobinamide-GDP ribazoletransferase